MSSPKNINNHVFLQYYSQEIDIGKVQRKIKIEQIILHAALKLVYCTET